MFLKNPELPSRWKLLQVKHFLKTSHVFRLSIKCASLVLTSSGCGPKSITLVRFLQFILQILTQSVIDSKLLLHI